MSEREREREGRERAIRREKEIGKDNETMRMRKDRESR